MTRSPAMAFTVLASALCLPLGWAACDYGAVPPEQQTGNDAAAGGGGGNDGGGTGGNGADAGEGGGGTVDGGGGSDFDHPSFPIASGTTHAVATCVDCHEAGNTDPARLICTTCHLGSHDQTPMATTHAGVGGLYTWSPQACVTCHPQAAVFTRADHSQIFPFTVGEGPHRTEDCSVCHTVQNDLTLATFVLDCRTGGRQQCAGCHTGCPADGGGGGDD